MTVVRGRGKHQNLNRRFRLLCIRRRRFKAARANICRWRMLHNAYKPIRFCTLNKLNRDWRNVAKKTSTSLMSTKLIVFGALFAREILRVDSPVSNIIYVPHVRPPRLPWRKCDDIFVEQHMTRHKKRPQCDPCLSPLEPPEGRFRWYDFCLRRLSCATSMRLDFTTDRVQ